MFWEVVLLHTPKSVRYSAQHDEVHLHYSQPVSVPNERSSLSHEGERCRRSVPGVRGKAWERGYVGDCAGVKDEADVCAGEYQLSPEALLTNDTWRDMLSLALPTFRQAEEKAGTWYTNLPSFPRPPP